MRYGTIKKHDIADGEGVRVSLFVSGCRNRCKGCFQPETWDFCYGQEFTWQEEDEILEALKPDYISGLTVLGGEPFEEENQIVLTPFLQRVRNTFPQKTIWCYTGYVYDTDLQSGGKKHINCTDEMLSYIDVLVDGPFIEELKDISLAFRGSSNQRILHLKNSTLLAQSTVKL
ncbi:MAG: anaerobic ribonucleoside-triphosphate reductase activating protein [Treponema sp.]|nr:anaerobic ribonucleoside-triphosphate reductase activating protein [Treponema sp.]